MRAMKEFSSVDTWVFDLDNTLYPRHCDLFSQIDILMTGYVANLTGLDRVEARKLQKELYRDYGTTLRGLMDTRGIDPHDFLSVVHNIDYSPLPKNPELNEILSDLPGRRLIYTNGSVKHAEDTLDAMGIDKRQFDGIFDIVASDFEPKPHKDPFEKFLDSYSVDPNKSAMFEDLPRNLEPAKEFGMVTVLITPQSSGDFRVEEWESAGNLSLHIDHSTDDLDKFLSNVLKHT
ncbi:MAG: pyrimidine 5'-nucleotidase [Pseudomonadota bacterium]